ncbi:MAG TPA: hypothetical protein PLQ54_04645 [Armatimonadota bacterium]|nr:hypothetical protein [Armatimonadota bacterium]
MSVRRTRPDAARVAAGRVWGGAAALLALAWAQAHASAMLVDGFDGTSLGRDWTADMALGSAVSVEDGRLHITARENTFAHIERPVGSDLITVSALWEPGTGTGASWCSSVFLYWAPGDWVQLGVLDRGGGHYYAVETGGGGTTETDLAACDLTRRHWLRIELGRDVVRYQARPEGHPQWRTLRVIGRPQGLAGAPKLLVLGKGYGRGTAPYAAPDLDNDYADPGPVVEAWFGEVRVQPTPASRQRLRPGEITPASDVEGDAILARPGDPVYDEVASVFPPLQHVREALGTKGHPDEFAVTEVGSLELMGTNEKGESCAVYAQACIGAGLRPFGGGGRVGDRRLLEGYMPVLIAKSTDGDLELELTVFGHSEGLSPDAPLWAYVRLQVTNRGAQPATVPVRLDTPDAPGAWGAVEGQLSLAAGGSDALHARIAYRLVKGASFERIDRPCYDAALEETRAFWAAELGRGMQIDVPDARLAEAWRAWLAYNYIDVDQMNGTFEPHDGSGFYEAVFAYSAARYAWVLDQYGRHDDAEAYLATLMAHQAPDGLLDWNSGLLDHGAYLAALAEHYRLTGNTEWLRDVAPKAVAACDWVTRRRLVERGRLTGTPPVTYGLIRWRPYCDYFEPVYSYVHNAYCCVGMERLADGLAEAGLTRDAQRIAADAALYRRDIMASMRRALFDLRGRQVLPMEPDTHRLLKATQYRPKDYYSIIAPILLEAHFLPTESAEARALESFLREEGGTILGACEFGGGIDHAYGYGYMEHQLRLGRPERYILGLYASLAYGMSRETYSGVEVTMLRTGDNALTLPHLYSGTHQLMMLRTMLVREEGDDLILCDAAPRDWLAPGKHIEVRGAESHFGVVSFRIDSEWGRGRIVATVDPPARRRPSSIVLRLRVPEPRPIVSVTADGKPWKRFDAECVFLPAGLGPVRVEVDYNR